MHQSVRPSQNGKWYTRWWVFLQPQRSVVRAIEDPAPALGPAFRLIQLSTLARSAWDTLLSVQKRVMALAHRTVPRKLIQGTPEGMKTRTYIFDHYFHRRITLRPRCRPLGIKIIEFWLGLCFPCSLKGVCGSGCPELLLPGRH